MCLNPNYEYVAKLTLKYTWAIVPTSAGDEKCTFATDRKLKIDAHLGKVHKIYARTFWKKVGKDIDVPESHPYYSILTKNNKNLRKAKAIYPCTWNTCNIKFQVGFLVLSVILWFLKDVVQHIGQRRGTSPLSWCSRINSQVGRTRWHSFSGVWRLWLQIQQFKDQERTHERGSWAPGL